MANAGLFRWLGVGIEDAEPIHEMPLSVGGGFESIPVFDVELHLRTPSDSHDAPLEEFDNDPTCIFWG